MNYGFKIPQEDPQDYVFGAFNSLPKVVRNPSGNWYSYLPLFEKQYGTNWDTFGCTVFGSLNAFETLLKCVEGIEYNFAERYNYNLINLEAPGADPKEAAQSIHEFGVIDQKELPFVDNEQEFKTPRPMSEKYINKGKEWLSKYNFQYEWVYKDESDLKKQRDLIRECLQYSPLGISVSAWTQDSKGEYISTQPNNHWCVAFRIDEFDRVWIFDTYDASVKILSPLHDIRFCMRYHVTPMKEEVKRLSITLQLLNAVLNLFSIFKKKEQIEEMEFIPIKPLEKPMDNKLKLIEAVKNYLDTDVSEKILKKDSVVDKYACAETGSLILQQVDKSFPLVYNTIEFSKALKKSPLYKGTLDRKLGNIYVAVSQMKNGAIVKHGHIAFEFMEGRLGSNDSDTGLFKANYTPDSFIDYFKKKLGLEVLMFEIL